MIISMQGNWTVTVKSKNAAFAQRFIVQGATSGNGVHSGNPGTSVNVTGNQWSIAVQNNPGTGWQSSKTKLQYPHQSGGNYEFDILSDDGGGSDTDFNDLILTCLTPANINDFIVYGNVTLYNGECIFNPCRKSPYVIDTDLGLRKAFKNSSFRDLIEKLYPERVPILKPYPNPPDPAPYFKPLVFDFGGVATQPKTALKYVRKETIELKRDVKTAMDVSTNFEVSNYKLMGSTKTKTADQVISRLPENIELVKGIENMFFRCNNGAGSNLTLTFEEYDRTGAELSGGAYNGEGNRRLLGNAITDMNGNYIFRFSFDMTFPDLEDAYDIAPGENVNVVMYPDIIVKIVDYSPFRIRYESAPFYNIPNIKRIDLCLPESEVHVSSACFNGNLIGSLGNVFIGGNQNSSASTFFLALRRYGASNYLESTGKISVRNPNAGFSVECAAWGGTIDITGCMYDASKSPVDNKIKWYTIRVEREGTPAGSPNYVSENYKHPKYSKLNNQKNYPNYIGDDVGPFYPNVGGTLNGKVPAYINIQREILADNIEWVWAHFERLIQLNTALYDVITGVRTPGRFFLRVDGYDSTGTHVPGATDLIALFIHNNGLNFQMTTPVFNDPSILNAGCGLFRLTDAQMKTPIVFSFKANDPEGFVDNYVLAMSRCPGTALDLNANIEGNFTIAGGHTFPGGTNPANVHDSVNVLNSCPGYKGTQDDYSNAGLVNVQIQPLAVGDGWIKPGEYFTNYAFSLTANQRVTNGYNGGLSGTYYGWGQILMERLNP